jgi:hypothetical protein
VSRKASRCPKLTPNARPRFAARGRFKFAAGLTAVRAMVTATATRRLTAILAADVVGSRPHGPGMRKERTNGARWVCADWSIRRSGSMTVGSLRTSRGRCERMRCDPRAPPACSGHIGHGFRVCPSQFVTIGRDEYISKFGPEIRKEIVVQLGLACGQEGELNVKQEAPRTLYEPRLLVDLVSSGQAENSLPVDYCCDKACSAGSGWSQLNSEPVAGRPITLADKEIPVAIDEELASLMIPSSRASRSIGRFKTQRSAAPAEPPTIACVGKAVYARAVG